MTFGNRTQEDPVQRTTTAGNPGAQGDAGFALVLALLALMLLTFLGLTLATTTSTELQIATNYRWSQQAYFNAEAGLEAAKIVLRRVQDPTQVLPVARSLAWDEFTVSSPYATPTAMSTRATRNFENGPCDKRGNGAGYGAVVDDGFAGSPYENVTTMFGSRLQGAFTIWVRRPLQALGAAGARQSTDSQATDTVIVTAEGVAPHPTTNNRAVRILEATFLVRQPCDPTDPQGSQTGGSPCRE